MVAHSPTTQEAAALASSRGLSCFFNATDKDVTDVDIYRFETRRN